MLTVQRRLKEEPDSEWLRGTDIYPDCAGDRGGRRGGWPAQEAEAHRLEQSFLYSRASSRPYRTVRQNADSSTLDGVRLVVA